MPIVQCENGHRYNNVRFKVCPFCKSTSKPATQDAEEDSSAFFVASIGLMESTIERIPVVGWVVCVEGPEKGRDYRIKSGRNRIGRSWKMDISLAKDSNISFEDHASIVYNAPDGVFQLEPFGDGHLFLNGEHLTKTVSLEENDQIRLGATILVFVPFSKPGRQWNL